MIAHHDWQVDTYAMTMIDGTEEWSATLQCECGYQTASDRTFPTPADATTAVERAARWSPVHGDL